MPSNDIILTARGVEVACGEKLPRLDILAYNGGLMRVPGWGTLAIDLAGLDLAGQVRVLADHDSSIDGILGHGHTEARDGRLYVTGAISSTTDAARLAILECVSSNRVLSGVSLALVKRRPFDFLAERPFLKNGLLYRIQTNCCPKIHPSTVKGAALFCAPSNL
jgi:hypothetical protein